jgi:hypothetical protein
MPDAAARAWFASIYDRLYSETSQLRIERLIVDLSAAGLLAHLALVFLARALANPPALISAVGRNYLAAIYTPFSFILFYEVLMLIAALPHSTTQSIAKQYEIVSLIFIRRFFKDIAELDDIGRLTRFSPDVWPVFFDVLAGLGMFLLVTVFLDVARRRFVPEVRSKISPELKKFISRKKGIAVALTALLVSLAANSLWEFGYEVSQVLYYGAKTKLDPNIVYYNEVFTVMIFADVLIVILSLAVSDRYELVFRNGAFVISTILIRFSLTVPAPLSAELAGAGMLTGILMLAIYNYHTRVREPVAQRLMRL